jgi:hypothetical protein
MFIRIKTVIVHVHRLYTSVKNQIRRITPDDENFASGVDRHLIWECAKGAYM